MYARQLAVAGVVAFSPEIHRDQRGTFASPFSQEALAAHTGRSEFSVTQLSYSISQRDTLRGIHFTRCPPGKAKFVCCLAGEAQDFVVDLRKGSPTFGRWDTTRLSGQTVRGLYVPVGVGHGFAALRDDTVISYMISGDYVPALELALSPLDPDLALPLPEGMEPVLSERDRTAPTLKELDEQGLLPEYAEARRRDGFP
ncbi:dTDP-4-dehydrorhamnose 3,5-epimerase family protein [Actinoalloteichus sp. GBA129-24]|uniref:dTDP-4-dehydrorhamnose 3,5-epimerase family protein n=1 Tax=Actinoalloteichus sp. GBA129-24 TaxID=1612551 RepID=UPI000950AD79|nr:dTDP-4-dehydrorhamnose 3,5-epimerase [Actinoalloteichus sp. GBA129-24]APU21377.1 dTDP-4-dehydrorhamnose 3,5-epimerase-like enzyme [Actinoalloteichus sp. GBA129-24]